MPIRWPAATRRAEFSTLTLASVNPGFTENRWKTKFRTACWIATAHRLSGHVADEGPREHKLMQGTHTGRKLTGRDTDVAENS